MAQCRIAFLYTPPSDPLSWVAPEIGFHATHVYRFIQDLCGVVAVVQQGCGLRIPSTASRILGRVPGCSLSSPGSKIENPPGLPR